MSSRLLLLLIGLAARAAGEKVEAVVFLYDDAVHTFQDVSMALEQLGLLPADALVVTQEVNDNGFGLVSKGLLTEAEATLGVLQQAGLNATVARCADVDVEIQRLAKKPPKANVTHDTSLQCGRWALTGACARRPLFMHSRCVVSCLLLGPRYQEAAHSRTPPQLRYLLPQLVLVLVAALALPLALSLVPLGHSLGDSLGGGPEARGARVLSRVATVLLMLHFLAEGARNMWLAVAGDAGFQLDDAAVIITNDTPVVSPTPAGAEEEVGALSLAYATALVMLAQALGNEPRWLRGALGLLQCAAAVHVLSGRALSRRGGATTLGTAAALCGFAAAGAGHVLLSLLYVQLLGGGLHLSELAAKKLSLVGGAALWWAHVVATHAAGAAEAPLPLHQLQGRAAPSSKASGGGGGGGRGGGGGGGGEGGGRQQLLLLLGRLLIASLLAAVCGSELWRLLGTPLTSFDNGDGHDDLRLRVPQLLLSLPLALGLRTSRVAGTLAVLAVAEALLMWQWWRPAVIADGQRLLRVSEHFTVNLAVSGSLMLLSALGSGRFTVDQLLKKSE